MLKALPGAFFVSGKSEKERKKVLCKSVRTCIVLSIESGNEGRSQNLKSKEFKMTGRVKNSVRVQKICAVQKAANETVEAALMEMCELHTLWAKGCERGCEVGERMDFSGVEVDGIDFSGRGFSFYCAAMRGAKFTNCNFNGVNFHDTVGDGTDFSGSTFEGADLHNGSYRNCSFRGGSLKDADVSGCDLERADFRGCNLSGADFFETEIDEDFLLEQISGMK